MRRSIVALAALALFGSACGSVREQAGVSGAPLLTVEEAEGRSGLASVQGFFWARPADNEYRLCSAALESFPPQCGSPALILDQVNVTELAGVSFNQNVFWADEVRVSGSLNPETEMTVQSIEFNTYDASTGLSFRVQVPLETERGRTDWVALVTNSGPSLVEVTFATGQDADIVLTNRDSGAEVYRWSQDMAFTQAERKQNISPGQTVRLVLSGDFDVPGGLYDLRGIYSGRPGPPAAVGRVVVR